MGRGQSRYMDKDYKGEILDGRYQVLELLDSGGMGAVYLGKHVRMDMPVAIKFLHGHLSTNDTTVKRFFREAKIAAKLQHPNIINVLDTGVTPKNDPYLVMEYLEGESLHALLSRTGPLGLSATLGIIEPVLFALQTAHDKGIVHRDERRPAGQAHRLRNFQAPPSGGGISIDDGGDGGGDADVHVPGADFSRRDVGSSDGSLCRRCHPVQSVDRPCAVRIRELPPTPGENPDRRTHSAQRGVRGLSDGG